jgi:hypothetical protein
MSEVLEIGEQRERAEEARRERDAFGSRVSILVALLAVITAGTSSLEATETAGSITGSSQAVLAQDRAADQWALYQAKSVKKNMFDIAAAATPALAADYARRSAKESAGEAEALKSAQAFEVARDAALEGSEAHERRHHRLAIAATLLEIGIAISTIAIITRKHWPWVLSAALGASGLVIALSAFF